MTEYIEDNFEGKLVGKHCYSANTPKAELFRRKAEESKYTFNTACRTLYDKVLVDVAEAAERGEYIVVLPTIGYSLPLLQLVVGILIDDGFIAQLTDINEIDKCVGPTNGYLSVSFQKRYAGYEWVTPAEHPQVEYYFYDSRRKALLVKVKSPTFENPREFLGVDAASFASFEDDIAHGRVTSLPKQTRPTISKQEYADYHRMVTKRRSEKDNEGNQ
jgi:hypothetical protein